MYREDLLERGIEDRSYLQGQRQTRRVLAALEITDGLVMHRDRVGEFLSAEASFEAPLLQAAEDSGLVRLAPATHAGSINAL